jgi:integrase
MGKSVDSCIDRLDSRRAGQVVAQLMGHANVDTTLNVYTQVLDGSRGRTHIH